MDPQVPQAGETRYHGAGSAPTRPVGAGNRSGGLHVSGEAMKYVWIGALLASLGGAEFLHELWRGEAPGAGMCVAPEARDEALRDVLVVHLRSH
jgi:hypothetical protein